MLLKKADDKSKRLALLEDLQRSALLDSNQKSWLEEQLWNLRKGLKGEKDAAFFLDGFLRDSKNTGLIHDLRIEVGGEVAQIDHLVIHRAAGFVLVETKNFSGDVKINQQGEFTVEYGRRKYGIESPIEQSRRHEQVLRKLCERIGIVNRVGTALEIHHVILFDSKSIISRPPERSFDTHMVIKADQFPTWYQNLLNEDVGIGESLIGLANLRSSETVKDWGEKLVRQHRPANQLELPEFMQPNQAASPPPIAVRQPSSSEADRKRLICLHCNAKISFPEGRFCWNNEIRFKGGQYCREHQTLF